MRLHDPIRRILIIKPSAMGDVVHGLPVLHGLRAVHPRAHIAWMVRPAFADVIRGHRELDEVIEFDRKHFGRAWRSPRAAVDLVRWLAGLGAHRFDLVVDLQGLFRSGFFTLMTGAGRRYGFAAARELGWLFYNQRVGSARNGPAVHAVERNYQFAGPLGFAHVPPTFELPIDDAARSEAHAALADAGIDPQQPFAVLVPGSTWQSKRWPEDNFAALADALDLPTVLLGGPGEEGVAERVRQSAKRTPADLVGRLGLKQSMAVIEAAALVVTNDSGPMHLAAAFDRPMVAIFGPTDPARTGPWGRPDAVVQAINDRRHNFRHDDQTQIAAVSIETAVAKARQQLAGVRETN